MRDHSESKSPRRGCSKSGGSDRSQSRSPGRDDADIVQQEQNHEDQPGNISNGAGDAGQREDESKENGDRESRDNTGDETRDSSRSPSQD